MSKKILIGTGNPAKVGTYKKLLKNLDLEIVSAKDLNIEAPEEKAKSFEEEAIKKAEFYFKRSGIPVIVDDGGFEIEVLNNEPGIKSRRWIGREMTDEEVISEVFKRMQGQTNRNARHRIVVALATPFGIFTSESEVIGIVPEKPSEKRWPDYPYNSVMYLPNYQKYWGDLLDENDIVNHRAYALEKIKDVISD
ncbi:MAG: non-canonical purine NTP pyrophosphatase [Candidatus Doudnabacteria bacterium]